MPQKAQATSVALIYRFFLNLPRKFSGLFWKCFVCISWFKKNPVKITGWIKVIIVWSDIEISFLGHLLRILKQF